MKAQLIIVFFSFFSLYYSQKKNTKFEITSDIVSTYEIKYPYRNKINTEQGVLLINSKKDETLFVGSNLYTLFGLQQKGKGNTLEEMMKYNSEINEIVYKKNDNLWVGEKIIDYNFAYKETPNFNWKISNETKKFESYTLRKAEAFVYGRNWTAWYIEADFFANAGPYKFFSLPGLIAEVYDAKNEYSFKLTQLKKKSVYFSFDTKNHKIVSKKDFYKIRKNINTNPLEMGLILNADELKKETKKLEESYKKQPFFDITFN